MAQTPPQPTIHSAELWKKRLISAVTRTTHRPVVFVLGDGIARDRAGGAWGVKRVLETLAQEYGICAPTVGPGVSEADVYQQRVEQLRAEQGQDEVARLFRRVVLAACNVPDSDARRQAAIGPENPWGACELLTAEPGLWHLPAGIGALADIIVEIQRRRQSAPATSKAPLVVTTNFDPLVELALRRAGVATNSYSIVNDQGPPHGGQNVGIWHVHGSWTDTTMHTPAALLAERNKLRGALRRRFDRASVFVSGYGGWQDLVFGTLGEILANEAFDAPPEILWAFFEGEEAAIRGRYGHVFQAFTGALAACQVAFYGGVDAHRDLPAVASLLSAGRGPTPRPPSIKPPPPPIKLPNGPALGESIHATDVEYADPPHEWHGPFVTTRGKHRLLLTREFRICLYPVTNQEFLEFVDDHGYVKSDYWVNTSSSKPETRSTRFTQRPDGGALGPLSWNAGYPDARAAHPVSGVSYEEALAFVAWLNARRRERASEWKWLLPTEDMWEFAARGPDARIYPWGDAFEANRCNCKETRLETTTPVGQFPDGVSWCGSYDFAGNVWEFVDASGQKANRCVLRGGSYRNGATEVRSYLRLTGVERDKRAPDFGIRCAQVRK